MTHQPGPAAAGATELEPELAPAFGDVPEVPFEHTPERLVLSSEEHTHLAGPRLAEFGGRFEHEQLGCGELFLAETADPGEVRVYASVERDDAPAFEVEANVRSTWLARVAAGEGEAPAARIVRELVRLAAVPGQTTVRIKPRAH